jgi:hypothetical protein
VTPKLHTWPAPSQALALVTSPSFKARVVTPTPREWEVCYKNYKVISLLQTFKCYLGAYMLSDNVVKRHF